MRRGRPNAERKIAEGICRMKDSSDRINLMRKSSLRLKEYCLRVCIFICTVGLCAAGTLRLADHRVHLERYDLIENGMTRADVERILGVPPGDYAPREVVPLWSRVLVLGDEVLSWIDEGGTVMVGFDSQGRVFDKEFVIVMPVQEPSWRPRGIWTRLTRKEPRVTGGID
jgi:hypothetical protein